MINIPFFDRFAVFLSKLTGRYFVRKCAVCGNVLWKDDTFLCADCLKIWSRAQKEKCPVCMKTAVSCTCRPISMVSTGRVGKRFIIALSFYGKPYSTDVRDVAVRRIIGSLKTSPDRRCIKYLAADMARVILRKLLTDGENASEWVICIPPRTKGGIRKYGYDQSKQLALEISRYTGLPFDNCFRNKGKALQKTLGLSRRVKNAEDSYHLKRFYNPSGKKYIIFDDIITTGATVSCCAKLLYGNGAENVFPVCIARTKPKKRKVRRRASGKLWFRQNA